MLHCILSRLHGVGRSLHSAAPSRHGEPHHGRPDVQEREAGPSHLRRAGRCRSRDPRLPHIRPPVLPHRQGGEGGDVQTAGRDVPRQGTGAEGHCRGHATQHRPGRAHCCLKKMTLNAVAISSSKYLSSILFSVW